MSDLPQKIFNGNDLPGINTGQEALFLLVYQAVKEKRIIQYKEVKHIYQTTVQVSTYTWDEYYDNEKQEWADRTREYTISILC